MISSAYVHILVMFCGNVCICVLFHFQSCSLCLLCIFFTLFFKILNYLFLFCIYDLDLHLKYKFVLITLSNLCN